MTSLVNQHIRHPVVTGMAAATCAAASKGKFILGLGSGAFDSLKAVNVKDEHPLPQLLESIEIIRKLLDGEKVTHAGKYYQVSSARLMHGRKYHVPIFIGAVREAALRFAASHGDGILISNCSSEKYVEHVIRTINSVNKRPGCEVACIISYIPTRDRTKGLKIARGIALRYCSIPGVGESLLEKSGFSGEIAAEVRKGSPDAITPEILDAMLVIGTADKLVERVGHLSKLGVTLPIIAVPPELISEAFQLPAEF